MSPGPDLSLTRRTFLRRSLQAAGALATLPAAACAPRDAGGAATSLRVIGPAELVILEAVTETFVPSGGAFPVGAREVDLARRIDALLAGQGPEVARGLRGALWLTELGAGPLSGRFARFTRLSPASRERAIRALAESDLALPRDVFAGLKQVSLFAFYAQPESWPPTGYEGPWLARGVSSS